NDEIPDPDHPLREPPDTLQDAMRAFFVGVAVGLVKDETRGNRSMLVHPSLATAGHKQYLHWVTQIKDKWLDILGLLERDSDRQDVIEDFQAAYDDLSTTVHDLPPFKDVSRRLKSAITRTMVTEVNATRGRTPSINWRSAYAHILVGGQAMD